MPLRTEPWRDALLGDLYAAGPAEEVLHAVIARLDRAVIEGDEPTAEVAVARAFLAVGPAFLASAAYGPAHPVEATLAAAAAFVAAPTDETGLAYFEAATASYPFGAGDGCYALVSGDCSPGSGCRSGAGGLASVAASIGAERVVAELRAGLGPWLRGYRGG